MSKIFIAVDGYLMLLKYFAKSSSQNGNLAKTDTSTALSAPGIRFSFFILSKNRNKSEKGIDFSGKAVYNQYVNVSYDDEEAMIYINVSACVD